MDALRAHDLLQPAFSQRETRNREKEITVKRFALLTAALAMLAAAGVAVAHHTAGDVTQVNATFSATGASNVSTRTLSCAGGQTLELSHGRYTGTATSGTGDLAGPVELRIHSVYNTTRKLGWVEGWLVIGASDDRTRAAFTAVNVNGTLDGWLRGSAGHRDGRLVGSFSASFTSAGGVTGGQLGTGTGANAALIVKSADCRAPAKTRPSVHLTVRGQVEALSATSITVRPADSSGAHTCTIGERKPERVKVGDRVEMTCAQIGGAWVLVHVRERS
jgi:hypothetical protein